MKNLSKEMSHNGIAKVVKPVILVRRPVNQTFYRIETFIF